MKTPLMPNEPKTEPLDETSGDAIYGDKRKTPVFTTGELNFFVDALRSLGDDEEEPEFERIPTDKAPITLTKLYAARTVDVLKGENFGDEALTRKVVTVLDPLISNNRPSLEIYNALHAEMEKTDDIKEKEKIWDIAIEALKAVVKDLFDHLNEALFEDDNLLQLERFFRTCISKIISPSVRKYVLQQVVNIFDSIILNPKQQQNTANAFIVALINYLSTNGINLEVTGSDKTLSAFRSQRIIEPKNDLRNPEAFIFSYSNGSNRIYDYLIMKSENSTQATKALELIRKTQNLGIFPKNCENFTFDQYEELCHDYFSKTLEILKASNDKEVSKAIISMWNEIIGPQLIIAGELILPHSTFLLPELKHQ